jgi:hypothetical protein
MFDVHVCGCVLCSAISSSVPLSVVVTYVKYQICHGKQFHNSFYFLTDLTSHFQNFYLVDPYLVAFIGAMLSRQFIYCILRKIIVLTLLPAALQPLADKIIRYIISSLLNIVLK